MDRTSTPSLLPIFRSQQQAELLALILGDPVTEHGLAELAERTGIPYASVHREVERAQAAGLVSSRLVGRTRLIRADATSPYFTGLADVLVKAFGVPWVLGQALTGAGGIDAAYVYGSWAARFSGEDGDRPVADNDSFHDTVAGTGMVRVPLAAMRTAQEDRSPTTARPPRRRPETSLTPTPNRRR